MSTKSAPINCNFVRVAIHHCITAHLTNKKLARGALPQILRAYNSYFQNQPHLQVTYNTVAKKFLPITRFFSSKWHPPESREEYLATFATGKWNALTAEERQKHTLRGCEACKHYSIARSFPGNKRGKPEINKINFTREELLDEKKFGKKVLKVANTITEKHFNKPIEEVIAKTPKSKLAIKPSKAATQQKKRAIMKEAKDCIQKSMQEEGSSLVLEKRLSWSKFDTIRKSEGLQRKRPSPNSSDIPPQKVRKHGASVSAIPNPEVLLTEAQTWSSDENVQWTELAKRHSVHGSNIGQTVKQFLKDENIECATINQRPNRAPRRSKKKLPGGRVSFPMHNPISKYKQEVKVKVESGEIPVGESVVPTTYTSYREECGSLVRESREVYARKIPLKEILCKMLQKHEELGLVRNMTHNQVQKLTLQEAKTQLAQLMEDDDTENEDTVKRKLYTISNTRHIKVWHDHSEIGGHSHFLVLVAAVYDPAFFFTPEEMQYKGKNIDVQTVVEEPFIHLLGRSTSSLQHQSMYTNTRVECLKSASCPTVSSNGTEIKNVIRYFHGDGPAMQFEAGNKVGGNYPCVGCDAHTSRFDDLAYSFRANHQTLAERQELVLQGELYKSKKINPFDKLKVNELRRELQKRGYHTDGKLKPELEQTLQGILKGISNVPAILQSNPSQTLESLDMQSYEVFPAEPVHDFKGHLSNLVDESLKITTGRTKELIQEVKSTVLSKATLRCSDYRRAAIILYKNLHEKSPDHDIVELYRTVAEIGETMYSREDKRNALSVLRFYNTTYIHGRLCAQLFSHESQVFGRYFHSITCHAATLYRLISLRSVNVEFQERMFGQAKQITKATSNNKGEHIITNIIIRLHEEKKNLKDPLLIQESEIGKLASTLPPLTNTIIPKKWLRETPTMHQAHLERISDYLSHGKDVWWKFCEQGIEFLDAGTAPSHCNCNKHVCHFRSVTTSDIHFTLFQQWEKCIHNKVELPATTIKHYN